MIRQLAMPDDHKATGPTNGTFVVRLDPDDIRGTQRRIDVALNAAKAWLPTLIAAKASVTSLRDEEIRKLETYTGNPYRLAELEEALRQLERGPSADEGCLEQVKHCQGRPGITFTTQAIEELEALKAEWANRTTVDPDATAGQFRLKYGKHCMPTGVARAGEVITLTNRQAAAWPDKFERIGTPAPRKEPVQHTTEIEMAKRTKGRRSIARR